MKKSTIFNKTILPIDFLVILMFRTWVLAIRVAKVKEIFQADMFSKAYFAREAAK